jgi:DNA-binding CsgD family transcriptional regulator
MCSLGPPGENPPAPASPLPADMQTVFWRNRTAGLFHRIPVPLAFCDGSGTILAANHALAAQWSTLPARLAGRRITELFRAVNADRLDAITEAIRLRRSARYTIDVSWTPGSGHDVAPAAAAASTAAGAARRHGELTVDLVSEDPDAAPNLLVILRATGEAAGRAEAPGHGGGGASAVEARILALAAAGKTSTRIAAEVGLTADGVNYHLTRLCRRWEVPNRTALIARAYVNGVLAADSWPPAPAEQPAR